MAFRSCHIDDTKSCETEIGVVGCRVWGSASKFGIQDSVFGFRVSGSVIRDSDFGFRVFGLGFRDSEFGAPRLALAASVP